MKNKIYCLKKPTIASRMDGSEPKEIWWGKFLRFGWDDGKDVLYHPIFTSLWPGLWLKRNQVRNLYWYEWIEYGFRIVFGRIKYFISCQKMAWKGLVGL